MGFGVGLFEKNLERDKVNAEKLRGKRSKYTYNIEERNPFYNINLSYGHEDCRIGK